MLTWGSSTVAFFQSPALLQKSLIKARIAERAKDLKKARTECESYRETLIFPAPEKFSSGYIFGWVPVSVYTSFFKNYMPRMAFTSLWKITALQIWSTLEASEISKLLTRTETPAIRDGQMASFVASVQICDTVWMLQCQDGFTKLVSFMASAPSVFMWQ